MSDDLPEPFEEAIIDEDEKLYSCLANFPRAKGHCVVVWKKEVEDLHLLSREDYDHLMEKVDDLRTAMIQALDVEKVYLVYMDEANHVHWHLIPRYDEKGYNLLEHEPSKLEDFSSADKIKKHLKAK